MDDADPVEGGNTGLYIRSQYTKEGDMVDFEGPLYADLCQQDDEFSILTVDKVKYKVEVR